MSSPARNSGESRSVWWTGQPRRNRSAEDSARGGWGVWLTPAHCHSERGIATGRVERYREAAEVL